MGQYRGRTFWESLVAKLEEEEPAPTLRAFAKRHRVPEKGLGYWRNKLRRERSSGLVPMVVRPPQTSRVEVAVRVRLGDEPVVELVDPERVSVQWLAELLRELSRGPR